jgi:hypothetical protein
MPYMKQILIFILIINSVTAMSQNFYISPLIGIKADVNRNNWDLGNKYSYFQYSSKPINFDGLNPLLLGISFEYQKNKNLFSLGFISQDQANSVTEISFYTKNTNPYTNYMEYHYQSNYAGWPIYCKVPLSYKRDLYTKLSPKGNKIFSLKLNTGLNLMFLHVKKHSRLENPISFGKVYTEFGDSIEFVGYDGNNQKSFSVSFNLGLDFDFYIKNKRRFNLQLYFEQGTKIISYSPFVMYKNDILQYGLGAKSRGSAIQFKLAFPICIYSKKE